MERVRIGFAGAGTMGQMAHLRNYVTLAECEVVALAELRERTGHAVAHRYGIPSYYRTIEDMLQNESLDAIVASQPFARHGLVLPSVLKAGKPVFIEKPLASSVDIGRRLVQAVEESRTFVMLGYHKRSDPATEYAKSTVDRLRESGELGSLSYIRILMPAGDWIANGFDGLIKEDDPPVALDVDPVPDDVRPERHKAYSTFVNYYIHQVNLLRYFLGESYHPVFADRAGTLFVAESESGITCTIEMSPYETTRAWQEEVLICFEHGWIRVALPAPLARNRPGAVTVYWDPPAGRAPIGAAPRPAGGPTPVVTTGGSPQLDRGAGALGPVQYSPALPWIHAMKRQAENFVAAVRGQRAPTTDAAEGLEDLCVAEQYLDLLEAARG